MLVHPEIDPVALQLGPLAIRWYGLMYVFAFLGGWGLGRWRAKQPNSGWTGEQVDDLVFYCGLGVVLGGRIGYVLFYNFNAFLANPLYLFRVWEGGMSFHGGLLGVLIAMLWYGRSIDKRFFAVTDFLAPLVPPGLLFGRLGKFIYCVLWGRASDLPWAMLFRGAGELPRHPSQLYQASLEGLVLFIWLWWYSAKPRPRCAVSGMFLLGYGIFRCIGEYFREPDAHIGYLYGGWLTMGIVLSLPMVAFGLILLWWSRRNA